MFPKQGYRQGTLPIPHAPSKPWLHKTNKLIPFFEKGINDTISYLSQTQEQRDAIKKAKVGKSDERIFLHIPYHPQNPSSGFVQNIWRNLVLSPPGKENLNQLTNWENHQVPIKRLIITYIIAILTSPTSTHIENSHYAQG
jgi:hypothetical protein